MDKIILILITTILVSCTKKEIVNKDFKIIYTSRNKIEVNFKSKEIYWKIGNGKKFISKFNLTKSDSLKIFKSLNNIIKENLSKEIYIIDKNATTPIIKDEILIIKNGKIANKIIFNFNFQSSNINFFDNRYNVSVFIGNMQNFINNKIKIENIHTKTKQSINNQVKLTL